MARRVPATVTRLRTRYNGIRDRLDARQRTLLTILEFLTIFTLLAAPVYLLTWLGWEAATLRQLTAAAAAPVIQLLGVSVQQTGTTLTLDRLMIAISRDSTAWKSVAALTALMIASRRGWRTTGIGVLSGVTLIFAANVARIASMAYAVTAWNVPFELLHITLWRWGLTGTVLLTWLAWLRYSR